MAIKDELLEQLMKGLDKPENLLGDKGLLQELKKALIEKALGAELSHPPMRSSCIAYKAPGNGSRVPANFLHRIYRVACQAQVAYILEP